MSAPRRYRIVVCRGPTCGDQRGSSVLYVELGRLIAERRLERQVELEWQACFGRCQSGPNIMVQAIEPAAVKSSFGVLLPSASGQAVLYNAVEIQELARILDDHIVAGRPIRALMGRKPKGIETG